jgi:predicted ester cyclase
MSLEENKAIVRRFIEAYNQQNLDLFDDFVAPDFVDHTHQQQGLENLKKIFNIAFIGMPDLHETIEDIIAEGDKVWARITYTGTHTGEWFGLAPTGKKVTINLFAIYRIVNGKIVEGWFFTDDLTLLKTLGVVEYTEQGKKLFPQDVK